MRNFLLFLPFCVLLFHCVGKPVKNAPALTHQEMMRRIIKQVIQEKDTTSYKSLLALCDNRSGIPKSLIQKYTPLLNLMPKCEAYSFHGGAVMPMAYEDVKDIYVMQLTASCDNKGYLIIMSCTMEKVIDAKIFLTVCGGCPKDSLVVEGMRDTKKREEYLFLLMPPNPLPGIRVIEKEEDIVRKDLWRMDKKGYIKFIKTVK